MDAITDVRPAEGLTLRLERRFAAPPALVFAAWTEARHLRRWSAPHGFEIPEAGGELRVGGSWHATMRSPEGEEHRLVGTYYEIEPPKRLAFTHAWLRADSTPGPETFVEVSFEPVDGGTLMHFVQSGFASEWARDGHGGGWSESFERLASYLADRFWRRAVSAPASVEPFVITRRLAAPRPLVWRCFTDAAQLQRWWGPKGTTVTVSRLDLRAGGLYHYALEGASGVTWGRFVFREVVEPERLVAVISFSDPDAGLGRHPFEEAWPQQLLTTFSFAEDDRGTRLTVSWEPFEASAEEIATFDAGRSSMEEGWTGAFDKLEEYVRTLG